MRIVLQHGTLIDPVQGIIEHADLAFSGETIEEIGQDLQGDLLIDCTDLQVFPGFVDPHVHFRQPGQTHKETIKTGLLAAARGGYTHVGAMANTKPPVDNRETFWANHKAAEEAGGTTYIQIMACSQGLRGRKPVDFQYFVDQGVRAFSDDGHPIADGTFFYHVLEASRDLGFTLIEHAEDPSLPVEDPLSEVRMVYRNLNILARVGGQLHLAHMSCGESIDLIRQARQDGLSVTCEVTPHHLVLDRSYEQIAGSLAKMNPPLRDSEDCLALQAALEDGSIDVIASDHAPHTMEEKSLPYHRAPMGVTGLETTVGVIWQHCYHEQGLDLLRLGALLSSNGAKLLGLQPPSLSAGRVADCTIIDPCKAWKIQPQEFASKGKNTPFACTHIKGRVHMVFHKGSMIWKNGSA